MSILTWIEEKKRLKLLNAPKYVNPASHQPDLLSDGALRGGRSSKGLWTRCDKCGVILYIKHLKENQRVCFGCTYHLQMSSQERIENLLDKESWRPFDETVSPCDPLEFHDQRNYTDRLRDAQDKTGLQDAIQTGTGLVDDIPVALGIMDFDFMGGSMGSVVGEKITRLIEYATQEGLTLLLVCASGGARMQEGVFSLMQMAKISSALQIYQSCANLLYISILTSPTTGGVTASFAMLGDIIFAEPKALIAFAGRRVIEQTLCEDLPEDFQTSEYMLHHGLVDLIVPRRFLRQALSESIRLYKNAPFKKPGRIPFGVQNPISFLTEEKLRRQCRTELDLDITRSRRLTKSLDFVQATPLPGVVESGLANSSNALTDQSRAINQPSVGSGRSVKQEAGTPFRLAPKGPNTLLAPEGVELERSSCWPKASSCRNGVPARQSVEYREILTSFQMMYQLFSKQMSNGVLGLPSATYPALENPWIKDKTIMGVGSVGEQSILELAEAPSDAASSRNSVSSAVGANPSMDDRSSSLPPKGRSTDSPNENLGVGPSGRTRASRTGTTFRVELPKDVAERDALARQLDSSLLQKFRELAEGVPHLVLQSEPFSPPEILLSEAAQAARGRATYPDNFTPSITKSKVETPSSNHNVPSLLSNDQGVAKGQHFGFAYGEPLGSQGAVRSVLSNNRDFLNQALELAATESVEWRAFYVHQTISKTTGFLEDFLSPDQYTNLLGSIGSPSDDFPPHGRAELLLSEAEHGREAPISNNEVSTAPCSQSEHAQLQNTLFYKSICRTTIS